MRILLAIFTVLLFGSCKVKKPKCTEVPLGYDHVAVINADSFNRWYSFVVPNGPLKAGHLVIKAKGKEAPHEANYNNAFTPMESREFDKEAWVWRETFDTINKVVRIEGQVNLIVEEKNYCFLINYDGFSSYAPPLKLLLPDKE